MDKGIKEARTITDDDERLKKQQEVCKMIGEDSPVIPLMFYAHNYCGNTETVKSLYLDPVSNPHLDTTEMA